MEIGYMKCEYCFAISHNKVPHGLGESCPLKVRVDEAYIAMLDAQRMGWIRNGAAATAADRMADAVERAFPEDN